MKRCTILSIFTILILLIGSIPFILLLRQDLVKIYFKIDNDKFIDLILVIIPFTFSSVIVVLNFMLEYIKTQKSNLKSTIDETNLIINEYNKIMSKAEINYNNIMNIAFTMTLNLERLKIKPIFNTIIVQWENNIKKIFDITNDENFRSFIRYNINELIKIYRTDNSYDIELEYLSSSTTNFHKYEIINLDERVFVFKLRNIIDFTKEEKNIIHSYLDTHSNGDIYNLACKEYIDVIAEYRNCFENEVRNRNNSDMKLFTLLYHLNIYTFYFCGVVIIEAYLIDNFMNIIVEKFKKYYEDQNKKYKKLNESINFDIINEPEFLKKYIDKETFYKFHDINKNANGA
jgi:hypothetical protein